MVRPDLHLPPSFVAWLAPFLAAFSRRSRSTTAALTVGALLAVGPRTVTNCLRALGLAEHPSFTAFHRVLNRNAWSGLALARTLLHMVVAAFVPTGPIIIGLDHTLEGACKVVGWSRQAANYVISSLPFHRRGTHSITPAPHNFACSQLQ